MLWAVCNSCTSLRQSSCYIATFPHVVLMDKFQPHKAGTGRVRPRKGLSRENIAGPTFHLLHLQLNEARRSNVFPPRGCIAKERGDHPRKRYALMKGVMMANPRRLDHQLSTPPQEGAMTIYSFQETCRCASMKCSATADRRWRLECQSKARPSRP